MNNHRNSIAERKIKDKFNVLVMGSGDNQEKLLLESFPILLDNSKIRHKYLNRFDFLIKERITFPKNFLNADCLELTDHLVNIDILILTYNMADKLSFEFLKKFYYLYFTKMEKQDKPKNVIIIETDYSSNEEKVDPEYAKKLANLFNGYFCDWNCDEEQLNQVLSKCLKNLLEAYNYIDDYSSFKYKELNKEINSYILVYGDKSSQNTFIDILLKSYDFNYTKIKDNFYEIKYEKEMDNNKLSFKIILKLVNNEFFYDSECNIFLYDINKEESFNSIKNLIRGLIRTNGAKFIKIYEFLSLNTTSKSENQIKDKIIKGKNMAYEIGANYSIINTNTDKDYKEKIKNKLDNILDQIINYINISKKAIDKENSNRKYSFYSNEIGDKDSNIHLETEEKNLPGFYIGEINKKIQNELKVDKNCLFNICKKCYGQLNVRINELSNIIIVYCERCKTEPKGFNIDDFLTLNRENYQFFICKKCKNTLNYNIKDKKLECGCDIDGLEFARKRKNIKKISSEYNRIPIFLKDCYCFKHNNFYNYYLKYSKIGLCSTCFKGKSQNDYYIEKFNNDTINDLIEQKLVQLNMEKEHINNIQLKFNECIHDLQIKFEKYIEFKIKKHLIKSDLIKAFQILKNNNTLFSNVKSLEFEIGQHFHYKENESIENRIKYIYNYLNYEANVKNINFNKNFSKIIENIHINPPYNNLEQNEKKVKATDIWGLNNNELICISFNDGQARIYDLKATENKYMSKCNIKEFEPNQGVNSLFVSKKDNYILKNNNYSKNEVIFLNGSQKIQIIQMSDDYSSYIKLHTIIDDRNNIFYSIEINNKNILYLNMEDELKLVSFYVEDNNNEIKDKTNIVNSKLIDTNQRAISIFRIKENIICLYLAEYNDIDLQLSYKGYSKNILNATIKNTGNSDNKLLEEEDEEKYMKIISIKLNNEETNKIKKQEDQCDDNNILIIENEYKLENYELIGCLSEDKSLVLINYVNNKNINKECQFSIFDCNSNQIIYSFKLYKKFIEPKSLIKLNFYKINDKQGFIILDKYLNIFQYFYDENTTYKIYYINRLKLDENKNNQIYEIISFIKNIIININKIK